MSVNDIVVLGGEGTSSHPPYTLDQLLAVRGAMWSVRWSGKWGPRPGQPTNILALDFYEWYDADERAEMRSIYLSRGYTHAVTGPMVDPDGYHGLYPTQPTVPTQAQWDHYLDCMQEWWDAGIIPIHFVHPDNWTLEDMEELEFLYTQPRAQALLPIVVPTGWEPTRYGWKAGYWRAIIDKVRGWMPNAVIFIHTVSDTDAPTGDGDDFPNGNAGAWEIVVPGIHGWLIQNGPYSSSPQQDPVLAANFAAQFLPTANGSFFQRFHQGYAGWPTNSIMGNVPIRVYNGEATAYESFWQDLPEVVSIEWGTLALAAQADGFLDGGPPVVARST